MNNLSDRIRTQIDLVATPVDATEVIESRERTSNVMPLSRRGEAERRAPLLPQVAAAAVLLTVAVGVAVYRSDRDLDNAATPPRPRDLPATGVVFSPADALTLFMAENTLLAGCMADKGWDYPLPTRDELVVMFGEWSPHPVLGIQGAGAARRVGYRSGFLGGFGSPDQANALQLMDADERAAFFIDLEGADAAPSAEGKISTDDVTVSGCRGEVQIPSLAADEAMRVAVNDAAGLGHLAPSGAGFDDVAIDDPRVKDALSEWSTCVASRTGERASTPNELARRFLDGNYYGAAHGTEIDVATADAECQQDANLWTVWYTVVAELTRERLGQRAGLYDDWTRARAEMVEAARAVVTASLPPLD